jgi:hypothetical protein
MVSQEAHFVKLLSLVDSAAIMSMHYLNTTTREVVVHD